LLAEPIRHIEVPGFAAVIFRRTFAQLEASGGPWPESEALYPATGATSTWMRWRWPSSATVQFSHLQHAKDRLSWKGAQIALIEFDQLEDFEEEQFWYLVSRNRSTCGVRPYIRATVNPVPEGDPIGGWVARLISWWIGEDGYPLPERAGVLRWFARDGTDLIWGASKAEIVARMKPRPVAPKSLTFIPMDVEENTTLLAQDPDYLATLEALRGPDAPAPRELESDRARGHDLPA
jgi:hypothetical protein